MHIWKNDSWLCTYTCLVFVYYIHFFCKNSFIIIASSTHFITREFQRNYQPTIKTKRTRALAILALQWILQVSACEGIPTYRCFIGSTPTITGALMLDANLFTIQKPHPKNTPKLGFRQGLSKKLMNRPSDIYIYQCLIYPISMIDITQKNPGLQFSSEFFQPSQRHFSPFSSGLGRRPSWRGQRQKPFLDWHKLEPRKGFGMVAWGNCMGWWKFSWVFFSGKPLKKGSLPKFNMVHLQNDGFQVRNLQTSRGWFSDEPCLTSGV